ncbi:leucine-rich repeat extensin-like protein 6 [Daucus carota subsp. sativus]|uniref:leucine-rich repeat extensin-like protein 6 n=1 Tax=Daucus carota subsp. sativus TaxID=79200 RepID=UPI003083BFA0
MNTFLWLFVSLSALFIFTPSHQLSIELPIGSILPPLVSPIVSSPPSPRPQVSPIFPNPRLEKAYIALQALKHAITSDPKNITSDWCGPNVCNYTGVYCAPALDNPKIRTVAGIDLNHGDISGVLPEALCLLTDLALFHINSNRFCGSLPETYKSLGLLYELDVSNNLFSGSFPNVVLSLPSLKFLDIRYNNFKGEVPSRLYDLKLDALFINNNNFQFSIPKNFGNSPVSVVVLANNKINGCFPESIVKMKKTLNELIISNSNLVGCLPPEIGSLTSLTVFDVSNNMILSRF